MSDWQPIETAPCDGTAIWLLVDGHLYIGYGESKNWLSVHNRWFAKAGVRRKAERPLYRSETAPDEIFGCNGDVHPTHWQPLPDGER